MNNTTTKAAETAKKAGTTRNTGVRTMVQIAMLAAVATVLMLWEVPMPFIAPSFYKMDLSEVPIMIGAFAMGPLAAAVIELIKPVDTFVEMGAAIIPAIHSLTTFCLFSVAPFNIIKGIVVSLITLVLYKHISRLLKGSQA